MNKNRGITLIALVITIIVLLILAGVTIAMLTGENGILNKANTAQTGNTIGKEKEEIGLAYSVAKAEKLQKGDTTPVKEAELSISLANDKINATAEGDNPIIVEFKDTKNKYKVDNNGNIEEVKNEEEEIEKVESTSSVWKIDVATQTIQQYLGTDIATITEITVPNYIDGVQVKKIAKDLNTNEYIFGYEGGESKAIKLEKLTISEGIESIGGDSFNNFPQLKTLVLKKGIKRIEGFAFDETKTLTNVTLPEGLEYIGEKAFYDSSISSITIPKTVKEIGGSAFVSRFEEITITALGNGNGTYYNSNWDYYEEVTVWGIINFVNDDVIAITCGGASGSVDSVGYDSGLIYLRLNKETMEATAFMRGYFGNAQYILPEKFNGYTVTTLGKDLELGGYTAIIIPKTIKKIEKGTIVENSENINFDISSIEDLKKVEIEDGAIPSGCKFFIGSTEYTSEQLIEALKN